MKDKSDSEGLLVLQEQPQYVIDASSIINCFKETSDEPYGKDVFVSLWDTLNAYISRGSIIAPTEVEAELSVIKPNKPRDNPPPEWIKEQEGRRRLSAWVRAKRSKGMFHPITEARFKIVESIIRENYKGFEAQLSQKDNFADPMIIALAKDLNLVVITSERYRDKRGGTSTRKPPSIPNVCENIALEFCNLIDFLRREDKKF